MLAAEYLTLKELTCFVGSTLRPLVDQHCTVRNISVLDGALWNVWRVRCGMDEVSLLLLLFKRSVQIVLWYLWYWYFLNGLLVCIRLHVIILSCDCIMKCIFVWTQVVNKLLLLLPSTELVFFIDVFDHACQCPIHQMTTMMWRRTCSLLWYTEDPITVREIVLNVIVFSPIYV